MSANVRKCPCSPREFKMPWLQYLLSLVTTLSSWKTALYDQTMNRAANVTKLYRIIGRAASRNSSKLVYINISGFG